MEKIRIRGRHHAQCGQRWRQDVEQGNLLFSYVYDENILSLLGIRIRIRRVHMFLGIPDPHPDPLVSSSKNSKKNFFLRFCDFFMTLC
jgi:hypothetical protein